MHIKQEPKIYIIRHGSTKLNSEDKIRGWMDLPLDEDGIVEAEKTAVKLKNRGIKGLISSDMKRTQQTAIIISEIAKIPILYVTPAFRPWNVGNFTGKPSEEALGEMERYARNKPDETLRGGESFNEFKDRFLEGMEKVLKEEKKTIGIVTHHRGDRILAAWVNAGMKPNFKVDLPTFFEKGIKPADFRTLFEKLNYPKEK